MPNSRTVRGLWITILVFGVVSPAWSWGRDGHRVVAKIAAMNLTPDTRKKVAAILETDDAGLAASMAAASTWPDEISKSRTGTGGWHYVDVPVTGPFDLGTLCAAHDCAIDRIQEMADRLRLNQTGLTLASPPSPPRPVASQEIAFLIHFVGDLHQPLHAADDGDRGGNCENLTTALVHADGSRTTELHAVWDVDEVMAVFNVWGNEDATAAALFQRFKDGEQAPQSTVTDWARESNDLARQDIYRKLNIPNYMAAPGQCAEGIAPVNIDQQYLDSNENDVERQLMRAGIRLSNVLNQICAGNGCQANPSTNNQRE
jgi:hypothetical protein